MNNKEWDKRMDNTEKKEIIKKKYQEIATLGGSCCSGGGCCGDSGPVDLSKSLGYSESDVQAVPDANLGLGCVTLLLLLN